MQRDLLIDLGVDSPRSRSILVSSPQIRQAAEFSRTLIDGHGDPLSFRNNFINQAQSWFLGTQRNHLSGLDAFPIVDVTMGCNHAIDSQLLRGPVQVLVNDYTYYWRLDPARLGRTPGDLIPGVDLIISLPFTGELDVHHRMQDILSECDHKGIAVHIDSAWITAAKDIEFDYDQPAIKSVYMSLSKGMDLWWNRVGLRWSREETDTDNVTIFNRFHMIPQSIMSVGACHMNNIPPDHLWDTYESAYNKMCKELYLRPTKMIHLAKSLDRATTYGVKHLLEKV